MKYSMWPFWLKAMLGTFQFPCGVNPRVPLVAEAGKPSPMVVRRWCSLPFLSVAIYADVNQKPPCHYNEFA
jgi:hypothetical protein